MEGNMIAVLNCVDNKGIVGDICPLLRMFAEPTTYWIGCYVVDLNW